ncbi:hypothetical protein [Martelella soudanensis]|uniref:hypothetical protein n=1 Tax=unclassified Martelella TaxID=2629616 RepID=UPI0015E00AE3|nr:MULTISPECIES: hypothetical protein [unclassified Martelella]
MNRPDAEQWLVTIVADAKAARGDLRGVPEVGAPSYLLDSITRDDAATARA